VLLGYHIPRVFNRPFFFRHARLPPEKSQQREPKGRKIKPLVGVFRAAVRSRQSVLRLSQAKRRGQMRAKRRGQMRAKRRGQMRAKRRGQMRAKRRGQMRAKRRG
jgi:hypothetical protein